MGSYRFEGFRVDDVRRRLLAPDGSELALSGRAYEVLAHLIEHRARVVGKDELLSAVWPRLVVEENNLNQAISELRRAFGDSRTAPRFILTVAGRGYRFIAPCVEVTDEPAAAASPPPPPDPPIELPAATVAAAPDPTSRRRFVAIATAVTAAIAAGGAAVWWASRKPGSQQPRSIAVLPFKPLVPQSADVALQIGMTESLINRLSRVAQINVAALSSVRRFSDYDQDPVEAGRQLGVAAVIDGYLQIGNGRVRATARMIDVDSGRALWSGQFDETLVELFAVQDSISSQLADALVVELTDKARERLLQRDTSDFEAWRLYVNGRYEWEARSAGSLQRAIVLLEAAVARDPRFALAHAALSDAWSLLGVFGVMPPREAFARARREADTALAIDDRLPEAWGALGHVRTQFDRNWKGGLELSQRALTLNPRFAQAYVWTAMSHTYGQRYREALAAMRRARELEPQSRGFAAIEGMLLYFAGELARAQRQLTELVEAEPAAVLPRSLLARVHLAQGNPQAAVALLQQRDAPAPGSFSNLGRAYAMLGRTADANAELARVQALGAQGFGVGFDLALIRMARGERPLALDELERGVEDGSQMIGYLRSEPALAALRTEPRFSEVVKRLGLVP